MSMARASQRQPAGSASISTAVCMAPGSPFRQPSGNGRLKDGQECVRIFGEYRPPPIYEQNRRHDRLIRRKSMTKTTGRKPSASGARPATAAGLSRRDVLAAAGVGAALLVAPGALRAQQSGERIAIGVMGPFTGPASRTGDAFKKGVQMALEDARKDQDLPLTVNGQKHDIDIVWVDSQSDPEKAVKAVLDALNRQHVKFM